MMLRVAFAVDAGVGVGPGPVSGGIMFGVVVTVGAGVGFGVVAAGAVVDVSFRAAVSSAASDFAGTSVPAALSLRPGIPVNAVAAVIINVANMVGMFMVSLFRVSSATEISAVAGPGVGLWAGRQYGQEYQGSPREYPKCAGGPFHRGHIANSPALDAAALFPGVQLVSSGGHRESHRRISLTDARIEGDHLSADIEGLLHFFVERSGLGVSHSLTKDPSPLGSTLMSALFSPPKMETPAHTGNHTPPVNTDRMA